MNNEIKNLIETVKEDLDNMNIVLNNEDRRKLDKVIYMEDTNKAVEEINMLVDTYFINKFLNKDDYNYFIEECNELTNDKSTVYQIGNGLLGYEVKATGERYESESELIDALEELEELK